MRRLTMCLALFLLPTVVRADAFDNYLNRLLAKIPNAKEAEKITKLAPEQMVAQSRVLPGINATFLVVKTNEGRFAKLLVQPGYQKVSDKDSLPIVKIERYVTYREGEDRTVVASGQEVRLFGGFRFSLDIGQVVPEGVSADLRVVVDKDAYYLEPVGKAEIYLVTKHLSEANPAKSTKLVVGEKFEMRYFNGAYKLYDDGRRSGTLHLKVDDKGEITGHYYSDKDGQKYDVSGKAGGTTKHAFEFIITYPRTSQIFTGCMFTGDGRAMAGTSRLQTLEAGFYALRIEDSK